MELHLPVSAGELTRAEQKILDYINTNPDTFLFLSIGQLAQRLELSDATVSRFARHVGCADFKELKNLVMEQSSGPAVKMAGTLSREDAFSPTAWLERQQLYLERPPGSWTAGSSAGPRRPSFPPGRSSSTAKTHPRLWPGCWPSACGGWDCR